MKKKENGREKIKNGRAFQTNGGTESLKKYLSLYDLLLANGGKRIAAVMALAVLAEGVLLYIMMGNENAYYENIFARGGGLPLMMAFVLLAAAMLDPMKAAKSRVNYTLRRLAVKPSCLYFTEVIYLISVFAVFWGISVMTVYGGAVYFTQNVSEAVNREMGVLLAFSRTHELWLLIPKNNPTVIIRNIAGIVALSASIARFNFFIRNGKIKLILPLLTMWMFTRAFYTEISFTDRNLTAAAIMLLFGAIAVLSVVGAAEDTEDEQDEPNEAEPADKTANAELADGEATAAKNEVCEGVSL